MSDTELMPKPEPVRRLEIFTGAGRGRSWSVEKGAIVAESLTGRRIGLCGRPAAWPDTAAAVHLAAASAAALRRAMNG